MDRSRLRFKCRRGPCDVSWDSPAPSLQPTPESRPVLTAQSLPLGRKPRPHHAISTLGIALCAVRARRGRGRPAHEAADQSSRPRPCGRAGGLDPGDAAGPRWRAWPGSPSRIQVARCPAEYRGGVAVADCRAVAGRAARAWPRPSRWRWTRRRPARAQRRGRGRRRRDGRPSGGG